MRNVYLHKFISKNVVNQSFVKFKFTVIILKKKELVDETENIDNNNFYKSLCLLYMLQNPLNSIIGQINKTPL